MKYRFEITYIPSGHNGDPELGDKAAPLKKTVEVEAHDSVPFDTVRQQVAFEMEEQNLRILTIEGESIE
jgi:hypothetical protein